MNRGKTFILAVVILFYTPFLSSAIADIYQYTDQNGVLHFTNVNGGGKHQRRVKSEPERSREAPSAAYRDPSSSLSSCNYPSVYVDIINNACERHGVDPSLVHALVKVESDFNPYAVSRRGARGLMQLMPQTALDMNVKNSFDPVENIHGGVRYLRYLIDRYEGNLSLALAAYNSGESAVKRWGTIPPFKETRDYVSRILRIYNSGNISFGGSLSTPYTVYVGYGEDGALLLTDNPSNHPTKKLKVRKKNL